MRKVFRHEHNRDYWDRRWTEAGRDRPGFENLDVYPVKYAEMALRDDTRPGPVLEIGAGLGRVVKHYRAQGVPMLGIERSLVAVQSMVHPQNNEAPVPACQADALALPFGEGQFRAVLAFGLYHNFETGLETGLAEAARVLRPGGRFCISMRPDNLEMRLNERYWRWKNRKHKGPRDRFHKLLVAEREFKHLLATHDLATESLHRARNVSILYRFPFLRLRGRDESENRSRGYRLNLAGRILDTILTTLFPASFCNVLVYVGRKEGA